MTMDSVFIGFIYALILVLILFIVKAYYTINLSLRTAEKNYSNLRQQINDAHQKSKNLSGSIQLLEEYNKSLVDRLFVIIKDILSVQKLIFGKLGK